MKKPRFEDYAIEIKPLKEQEGVSLNTLVLTYIAEGIGKREGKDRTA